MTRFHVHIGVENIDASISFYSTLFAAEPTVRKPDYAKWMLENPLVNFAISQGRGPLGIHHLGIQAEDRAELGEVYDRLDRANRPTLEEGETVCCYAKSEKSWVMDPQGVSWETFLTLGDSTLYGGNAPALGSAETPSLAPSCACGPVKAA
jgi:catechol 2,3-dioxygenase-like lactoylglutathione lyase family enzyme